MSNDIKTNTDENIPEPMVRRRRVNAGVIWIVPVVAALIGISLMLTAWWQQGPTITITFQSAEGLTAGKTEVKYKNVVIGKVTSIRLSNDRKRVLVKAELDKSASSVATADTRFWVVRPRIGLGGVSGVDTLLSGSFIGVDVGKSHDEKDDFTGLENPPAVTHDASGQSFVLHATDLGSLDIGSPLYFRRIQVGRVASYNLDKDGKGVSVQVFVEKPYDQFVTTQTRFWNASGVDVSLGADGLKLNTQSLATVLAGGVAFLDAPGPTPGTIAEPNASYTLFDDQATAMAPPSGAPHYIRMRFNQPVRGLSINAPVEFLGVNIGNVVSIRMDYDEKTQKFPIIVGAIVYPERLGDANKKLVALAKSQGDDANLSHMMGTLIAHGLRAQARVGNLLTGQLYIAMDFQPNAQKVDYDPNAKPLEIPTAPGNFDKLQEQIVQIVDKIQKIPFDQIGNNINQALVQLSGTLKQVNTQTLPAFNQTLKGVQHTVGSANDALSPDSPLQQNIGSTLEQLQRAARSVRSLTDYLSAHPDSLLRGRAADAPVAPTDSSTAKPQQGSKP